MIEDVADHLGGLQPAGDSGELIVQPFEEPFHQRSGLGLADGAPFVGRAASDFGLNAVEGGDPLQRFHSDRRGGSAGDVDEVPTDVRPTVREEHLAGALSGQGLVGAVSVALHHALEGLQELQRMGVRPAGRIGEDDAGRVASTAGTGIAGDRPHVALLGGPSPGVQHRRLRLVDEQHAGGEQLLAHQPPERLHLGGEVADPRRQHVAADLDALTGQRLGLAVERLASRAGGSHPRALPEPYVNLSAHTAPSIRP